MAFAMANEMFDKQSLTVYDVDYFVVPARVRFYNLAQLREENKIKASELSCPGNQDGVKI